MIHINATLSWYTCNDDIYYYVYDRGVKISHIRLGGNNFKIVAVNIINDVYDYMLVNGVDKVTIRMPHFRSVLTIEKVEDRAIYDRVQYLTEYEYSKIGCKISIKGRYGSGFRAKWYRFWFLTKC